MSTGATAGQAVTLLAVPVLSRLYSPEAYGAFASLIAVVSIAATAGSLRLETAIPIAELGDARNLAKVSTLSSLVAGAICAVVLLIADHPILTASPWLGGALVVYLVWITSLYGVLTSYSLRSHRYSAVARRSFLQSLGTALGQLAVSAWVRSALGLTVGLALGRTLGLASLFRENQVRSWWATASDRKTTATLRRYSRFPLVFMPAALFNVLGAQLPLLLVARLYGDESAGNLAQAITVGAVPAALFGTAVASVAMAEMASQIRAGDLNQRPTYLRLTRALLPIGITWMVLLVLVAPDLLPAVLGPEWTSSGEFAAALAVGVGVGLFVSPLTAVLFLYERSLLNLGLDTMRVVVVLSGGLASWSLGYGPVGAVFVMSCALCLVYGLTWIVGLRIVSRDEVTRR
jgi:O-antigen/teichoic acid export membrane protein